MHNEEAAAHRGKCGEEVRHQPALRNNTWES